MNKENQNNTSLETSQDFFNLLDENKGLVIIKLGATWCAPCKKIAAEVNDFFLSTPESVTCCNLDIEENPDFYVFLKHKRIVSSIPTLLCYKKNNTSFAPDDFMSGADPDQLHKFFQRCNIHLRSL